MDAERQQAERVAAFIRAHGHAAIITRYNDVEAETVFTLNGKTYTEWEIVRPTLQAARLYCGY